ncbi:MAG: L-lactate dehydrogenase [Ilumatobacteraceae bacterium]
MPRVSSRHVAGNCLRYGGPILELPKIAVVGAGSVGAAVAYAVMIDRLADRIALFDIDGARARAEALDLSHGLQFVGGGHVDGSDEPEVCRDADLIIVTAGAAHGPGRTRLDLASVNSALVRTALPPLLAVAPEAIVLLVTNPVDVVTFVAQEALGLPHGRVIGSGTVLDTSRLRHLLAERLAVAVNSVHATVVGEHGDSEIVLWSTASVGGTPLLDAIGPDGGQVAAGELDALLEQVRTAAMTIIAGKGNTNLAIGLATARIARAIARDEHAVLPVSVRVDVDGVGEVCLSLPAVVGRAGVLSRIAVPMDDGERSGLRASAAAIRSVIAALG